MQWQPIETAPKDGTVIFIWYGHRLNRHAAFDDCIKKAQWLEGIEEWRIESVGGNQPYFPLYWMPLPEPPTKEGGI